MGFKKKATKKNKENKETRKPIVRSKTGCIWQGEATHLTRKQKHLERCSTKVCIKQMNGKEMTTDSILNMVLPQDEDVHLEYNKTEKKMGLTGKGCFGI